MSKPTRCAICAHRKGPWPSNMTQADKTSGEPHAKKAGCSCACHTTAPRGSA
jgi:hypothetical protein